MNTARLQKIVLLACLFCPAPLLLFAGQEQPPKAKAPSSQSSLLSRYDTNKDGVISFDEFPETLQRFTELDTNGNHVLESSELPGMPLKNVETYSMDDSGRQHKGGAGMGGPGGKGGGPGRPSEGEDHFEQDDANSDGKVSREEFSGPKDLFDKLDRNKDGYLTEEEARPEDENGRGPPGGPPPGGHF